MILLDSWAVLRLLEDAHPAAAAVAAALGGDDDVVMSWINLGEVHHVVRRVHGEAAAMEVVRDLQPRVRPLLPDADLVLAAARFKADHAMSYADAFAAASAVTHDAELWTGDPELLLAGAPWRWRDLR